MGKDRSKRRLVAHACDVSEQSVRNWMAGLSKPKYEYRLKIFEVFPRVAVSSWDRVPPRKRSQESVNDHVAEHAAGESSTSNANALEARKAG